MEEYGFDALSVYGDLMFQPPIGPFLILAQATTRIRLGPASLNPYTLHPVEIAGQIALLDAVSCGRAYLGLSRGAWLDSLGIAQTKPVTTMREAVAVVRRLIAKERAPFDGAVFRLSAHNVLQYAARRRAKEEIALYLPTVASLDPTVMVYPTVLARIETAVQQGDRQAAALISDDLLRLFAFAGSPADIIAHAEAIFAAGASRIEFGTPHGLTDAQGIQLLGEKVLPALHSP